MSKKPGIFGAGKNTLVNTLINVDKTLNSGLSMVSTTMAGVANFADEFANDTSADKVISRVNLLKGNAQHRADLKELGYDDATIDQLLSVEIH